MYNIIEQLIIDFEFDLMIRFKLFWDFGSPLNEGGSQV